MKELNEIPYICKIQSKDGAHVRKSFVIENDTQIHMYQTIKSPSQHIQTDDIVLTLQEAKLVVANLQKFIAHQYKKGL